MLVIGYWVTQFRRFKRSRLKLISKMSAHAPEISFVESVDALFKVI